MYAHARGAAVNQPQRCLRDTSKQPPSGAQHQRSNHQQILVDQIGSHQRADQHAATHDHEVRARALLEVRRRGGAEDKGPAVPSSYANGVPKRSAEATSDNDFRFLLPLTGRAG